MRTTNHTARGLVPLAVLLLLLAWTSWAVMGEGTLHIDQTISPNEIYVAGTGEDDDTTSATLNLSIAAPAAFSRYPIDCLLLIDSSETSDLVSAKQFAYGVIDQLGVNDRIGLVSYSTTAELDMPMTHNVGAVKLAVSDLTTGGRSAMGLALQMAQREFQYVGRDEAVHVIVLVTDGQSSVGIEPDDEGEAAAQMGIKIISVGNGTLINRNLLETFAEQTDGLFFESTSERTHTDLFAHLADVTAASDVVVEKHLPAGLRVKESSPKATQVEILPDGTSRVIWRLQDLSLNGSTRIEMELEATQKGEWQTDESSSVTYYDFRDTQQTLAIESLTLNAIVPNEAPVASFVIETQGPWAVNHEIGFEDASTDEDGEVVAWEWSFGDGYISSQQDPTHAFEEIGDYEISLVAIDEDGDRSEPFLIDITVGPNQRPVAAFSVMSEPPLDTINPTVFRDESTDPDGDVVAWEWTFDDGETSKERHPEHVFDYTGTFSVSLVAIDSDGARSQPVEKDVTIELGPRITVTRTIETCLPGDEIIAGELINVRLVIDIRGQIDGLAVIETFPSSWAFTPVQDDNATRVSTEGTGMATWLFPEKEMGTEIDAQREILYTLMVPETATVTGTEQHSIEGYVSSSSPRFSQAILGEDKIAVRQYLSIPVAISRWDTDAGDSGALVLCGAADDPEPAEIISFEELNYATSLWSAGLVVPYTNGLTIDIAMMQDLIAYWASGRSVHDPLP